MKAIDGPERRFGLGVTVLGVLFTAGLNVPYLFGPSQYTQTASPKGGRCEKGYTLTNDICAAVIHYRPVDYLPFLAVGLIAAAAVGLAVWFRRRTPAVFASLLMGLIVASQPPAKILMLGAPFWIFSGWLMVRSRRIQKFGSTDPRIVAAASAEQRAERRAAKASGAPRPRPERAARPARGAKPAAGTTKAKQIESGRYTPKKPAPRKVPPPAPEKPSRFKRLIGDEKDA